MLPVLVSIMSMLFVVVCLVAMQSGVFAMQTGATCRGFTEDATDFASASRADLLPETGVVGLSSVFRGRVVYSAADPSLRVLDTSGRCAIGFDSPQLCGLEGGGTAVPEPGAALTAWGAEYRAGALTVTVQRASDLQAGLPGLTWQKDPRRPGGGFVGFCASRANPIVGIHFGGPRLVLANVQQTFDPRGRRLDVPDDADVATMALAAQVDFQLEVDAAQRNARSLRTPQAIVDKYTRRLGLPATTPYATLMTAVMRDGRFADEYVADITEINRTVGAAVAQSIALARERLERTLTRIGYRPPTTDIADLVTEGADGSGLVFSGVIAHPVSVLGITAVPLNPITFERLAVPDLLGGQLGPDPAVVVRACGGPGPCNYPQPYDLVARQIHVVWKHKTLTPQQVEDIVAENGYVMTLTVNDEPVAFGPKSNYYVDPPGDQGAWAVNHASSLSCTSAADGCFTTVLIASRTVDHIPFPWKIRLRVEKLTPLFQPVPILGQSVVATHVRDLISSSSVTVHSYPGPGKHLSYFKELLLPTYRSQRCETCHGFETKKALRNHGPHGGVTINLEPSLFVPGAHVMTCSNCHYLEETNPYNGAGFQETEWRVPFVDLDTNWQTKSPSAVCQRTNQNLVDVFDRLRHFSGDARLFWSMEDATTPSGAQLSKAFPQDNFGEWMRRTTIWSTHLAPCP